MHQFQLDYAHYCRRQAPNPQVYDDDVASFILSFNDMNWVQRKIYLYNVTFGLYMLDWWERFLFNTLVLVLMWFIFYNGSRNLTLLYKRYISEAEV